MSRTSIIVLSYNYPEVTEICLRTVNELTSRELSPYELVLVDNSGPQAQEVRDAIRRWGDLGWYDRVVLNDTNRLFAPGNNDGVRASDPTTDYILLMNSDVAVLREDWLAKLIAWMEGTIEYRPSVWPHHPTTPDPGPRDIVSCGWAHDANVLPGHVRPDGFCILFRRSWWRDLDEAYPWHGGMEHTVSNSVREGAKCGVLSQYPRFIVHREGGSRSMDPAMASTLAGTTPPDIGGWFNGLRIESLDFTLGPNEHDSYLWWD